MHRPITDRTGRGRFDEFRSRIEQENFQTLPGDIADELRDIFRRSFAKSFGCADPIAEAVASLLSLEVSKAFLRTSWAAEAIVTDQWEGTYEEVADAARSVAVEMAGRLKEQRGRGEPPPVPGLW